MRKNKDDGRESERGRSCSDTKSVQSTPLWSFTVSFIQSRLILDWTQSGPSRMGPLVSTFWFWTGHQQTYRARATALQPKLIGGIFIEGFSMTHLMTNRFGFQVTSLPHCSAAQPYQMEKKKP